MELSYSNQETDRIARPRSDGYMFNDGSSWLWFCGMARASLLALVLAGTVTFTTGCSSTGGGARAGLIAPVINAQPGVVPEDDGGYLPPRSPSFNDSTGS